MTFIMKYSAALAPEWVLVLGSVPSSASAHALPTVILYRRTLIPLDSGAQLAVGRVSCSSTFAL